MIAELGQLALIVALFAALAQAGFLLAGTRRGLPALVAAGGQAAIACAFLVLLAGVLRAACFAADDLSVAAVLAHSHPALPPAQRIAASWSDGAGALLLLAAALSLWTLAFRLSARGPLAGRPAAALGAAGLVSAALLAAMAVFVSPFARSAATASSGRAGEFVLRDPATWLQPPLVAAGVAGLAVVFALGWAALRERRPDAAWARDCRPWLLGAWIFLSAGMAVGMAAADRSEAADGRWWSWQPLEAALLAVWLAATALLHVLSAAEKRRHFLREAAVLALVPFPLACLGAWLLREGLPAASQWLAPEHGLGRALLLLLAASAGLGLAAAARRPEAALPGRTFEIVSREAGLAAGAVLLLAATAAVLIGLGQPLVAGHLGLAGGVGAGYFDGVFVPLMVPALALMGPGPRLHWSSEAAGEAWRDSLRPALAGSAIVAASTLLWEGAGAVEVMGLFLSAWIAWHAAESIAQRWRPSARRAAQEAGPGSATGFHATHVAHLGVALFVAGATLSGGLEQTADLPITPGVVQSAGELRLRTDVAQEVRGEGYRALRLRVWVREGERETLLEPELRFPPTGGSPVAVAAIDRGLRRDLHVSVQALGGPGGGALRVRARPFMGLLWAGIVLALAGGVLALAGRAHQALGAKESREPQSPGKLAARGAP